MQEFLISIRGVPYSHDYEIEQSIRFDYRRTELFLETSRSLRWRVNQLLKGPTSRIIEADYLNLLMILDEIRPSETRVFL